jgi:hypothetical protein
MTSLYDCCGFGGVSSGLTPPCPVSDGSVWFDLNVNQWKVYTSGAWSNVGGAGGGGNTVNFLPPTDTSVAPAIPVGGYVPGNIIVHNGNNGVTVAPGYNGAAGKNIDAGDLLVFDGTIWHVIGPSSATKPLTTVDINLPANVAGIGAAWTAFLPKPTEQLIFAEFNGDTFVRVGAGGSDSDWLLVEHPFAISVTPLTKTLTNATVDAAYGALPTKPTSPLRVVTFDGATYLVTGAGTSPTDFHILGGKPLQFADPAEVLAGAVTDKIIAPDSLQSRITGTPDATPANDARKLVMLGAGGKIANGFLSFSALTYIGAINPTTPYAAPATPYEIGSFGVIGTAGVADASWAAMGVTGSLNAGDMLVWNGTGYDTVEHEDAFVQLAGANTLAADQTMVWNVPAAAGMVTRLDGGDNTKAQIENFHLKDCTADAGSF